MDNLLAAIELVFRADVLLTILLASVYGILVGAMPGVSATLAVAMLVPITFFMDPVPAIGAYRPGRYGMYEVVDAKAILAALREGRAPGGSVLRSWLGGDRALFWFSDPKPAVHQLRQAIANRRTAPRPLVDVVDVAERAPGT